VRVLPPRASGPGALLEIDMRCPFCINGKSTLSPWSLCPYCKGIQVLPAVETGLAPVVKSLMSPPPSHETKTTGAFFLVD
jgi:hypothetical protein